MCEGSFTRLYLKMLARTILCVPTLYDGVSDVVGDNLAEGLTDL